MNIKTNLLDTGCENKHQTCKECLDKINKKINYVHFVVVVVVIIIFYKFVNRNNL